MEITSFSVSLQETEVGCVIMNQKRRMRYPHFDSPSSEKFKRTASFTNKVLLADFWGSETSLFNRLPRETEKTVNSERYIEILKNLKRRPCCCKKVVNRADNFTTRLR